MRYKTIAVAGLLAAASVAGAQDSKPVRLEIRPFAGTYLPTGTQADEFKQGPMFGAHAALELSSNFHVLGSVGWTNSHSKFGALVSDQAHMLQYDAGLEVNGVREFGQKYLLRPFVGVGAGARSYQYKDAGIGTKTCVAGYAGLGSELQRGAFALRFETRGYVSCFKQPFSSEKKIRNDASFMLGLAYHIT